MQASIGLDSTLFLYQKRYYSAFGDIKTSKLEDKEAGNGCVS